MSNAEEMLWVTKQFRELLQNLSTAQQLSVLTKLLFELAAKNGWSKARMLSCLDGAFDIIVRENS